MRYEILIGLRYLFSKKKEPFIVFTTWSSILGVAIGVMALIVVIGVMTGFQSEIRDRILSINPHILLLSFNGLKEEKEFKERLRKIEGVEEVFSFLTFQAILEGPGEVTAIIVKAVDKEGFKVLKRVLMEAKREPVLKGFIFLGKELAKRSGLSEGDVANLLIPFSGYAPFGPKSDLWRFKIGGLFETGIFEIDNGLCFMSIEDAEEIFGKGVMGFEIRLKDIEEADKIKEKIEKNFPPNFMVRTWKEMNRSLFSALRLEKIAMFIILALIVFVAGFNIISTLMMTVMEKKKDIAILKACGATKRSLIFTFVVEGLFIGGMGAVIGALSGYTLCELLRRYKFIKLPEDIYSISEIPVKISLYDVGFIALLTILICLLSTIYPAYKASQIEPQEILRYE